MSTLTEHVSLYTLLARDKLSRQSEIEAWLASQLDEWTRLTLCCCAAAPRVGERERGGRRVAHGGAGRRLAAAAHARAAARAVRAPRAQRQAGRALRGQDHARRQVSTLMTMSPPRFPYHTHIY